MWIERPKSRAIMEFEEGSMGSGIFKQGDELGPKQADAFGVPQNK